MVLVCLVVFHFKKNNQASHHRCGSVHSLAYRVHNNKILLTKHDNISMLWHDIDYNILQYQFIAVYYILFQGNINSLQ